MDAAREEQPPHNQTPRCLLMRFSRGWGTLRRLLTQFIPLISWDAGALILPCGTDTFPSITATGKDREENLRLSLIASHVLLWRGCSSSAPLSKGCSSP